MSGGSRKVVCDGVVATRTHCVTMLLVLAPTAPQQRNNAAIRARNNATKVVHRRRSEG